MYGFLRIPNHKLNKTDGDSYKKSYCGQCHALQKHFGYTSRALLSYDTTLIGLLIDAQSQSVKRETKAWCAVFPRKVPVYHPDEMAQKMAASLAVALLFTKLNDALQEKKSFLKTVVAKYYQRQFNHARKILEAAGFNTDLIDQLLAEQAQVELQKSPRIEDYAQPSARITAEVFRFTATLANLKQNESILYEIGYHVGICVYLIDSCIDILDDVEKQKFNALLAAYQDNHGFSAKRSQHEVVRLVIDSLRTIQTLTKQLTLYHHQSLVEGILLQGFPSLLHQQVYKSVEKLEKNTFIPVNYLPHAALASALCFFTNEANAAFVWGEEYNYGEYCGMNHNLKVYGYMCSDKGYAEMCFNPCACVISKDMGYASICCNIPKYYILGIFNDEDQVSREIAGITFVLVISFCLLAYIFSPGDISESNNNNQAKIEREEKIEKSIRYFVENTSRPFVKDISPELQRNIQKIDDSLTAIKTKIQNLQKLQSQFPAQKDIIHPKIAKLNKLKNHLEKTSYSIQMQLRKAYVIHEANKIEGIGQSISLEGIFTEADNALQHAKAVLSSIEETNQ
jgi:hypothetical protein